MQTYELDPAWYFTSPVLERDAALKITEVKLEFVCDANMLLMFERGIRGVAIISDKYVIANNKYIGDKYDPDFHPNTQLTSTLKIWTVAQLVSHYQHMASNGWQKKNWKTGKTSCILEVDMEYPISLHELHYDNALAPESLNVNRVEKLIPSVYNKAKCATHQENLKMYVILGLKTTWVHRGIKFKESPWLQKVHWIEHIVSSKGC